MFRGRSDLSGWSVRISHLGFQSAVEQRDVSSLFRQASVYVHCHLSVAITIAECLSGRFHRSFFKWLVCGDISYALTAISGITSESNQNFIDENNILDHFSEVTESL